MKLRERAARVVVATLMGVIIAHGVITDFNGAEHAWRWTLVVAIVFSAALAIRELATWYYVKFGPDL